MKKTVNTAYIWLLVGPFLGVAGAHRFYLHRFGSAGTLSLAFFTGLVIVIGVTLLPYFLHAEEITLAMENSLAPDPSPEIEALAQEFENWPETRALLRTGHISFVLGSLWWVLDWFLLPGMVRKFNAEPEE